MDSEEFDHRKEFDERTRKELAAAYSKALLQARPELKPAADPGPIAGRPAGPKHDPAADMAEAFVCWLEGLTHEPEPEAEEQQRRVEKLEAVANALETFLDAVRKLDEPACGYALWRGLSEMAKGSEFSDNDRANVRGLEGIPAISLAHDLQKRLSDFRAFALGVRHAIKNLPKLDRWRYSFEEDTARGIERYLESRGIPFTTSETGLAGRAFHAVMRLAGRPVGKAGYYLAKARAEPGLSAKDREQVQDLMRRLRGGKPAS
jgi:hypothetical protein